MDTELATDPRATVLAESPGGFFENLAFGPDNALYVTDYTHRRILRHTSSHGTCVYADLDVHPLGIAFDAKGTMFVSAQELSLFGGGGDMTNANLVLRARSGEVPKRLMKIEGSGLLNGLTPLGSSGILLADSRGGIIWLLDTSSEQVERFIVHELLDASDPSLPGPAANGVKVHRGHMYVSNSMKGLMVRVPLSTSLRPTAPPEIFAEEVRADDFAFSPDGRLFYTSHRDKIFYLHDGKSSEFADASARIVGNTALAWSPDGCGLYVVTDGGFAINYWYGGPPAEPARVVRFSRWD
jgi:sugar lactone lactonase YvrE